jgi:hypothetical protein
MRGETKHPGRSWRGSGPAPRPRPPRERMAMVSGACTRTEPPRATSQRLRKRLQTGGVRPGQPVRSPRLFIRTAPECVVARRPRSTSRPRTLAPRPSAIPSPTPLQHQLEWPPARIGARDRLGKVRLDGSHLVQMGQCRCPMLHTAGNLRSPPRHGRHERVERDGCQRRRALHPPAPCRQLPDSARLRLAPWSLAPVECPGTHEPCPPLA